MVTFPSDVCWPPGGSVPLQCQLSSVKGFFIDFYLFDDATLVETTEERGLALNQKINESNPGLGWRGGHVTGGRGGL